MKKALIFALGFVFASSLFARNDILYFPLKDVLESEKAKEIIDPSIELIFGSGNTGEIVTKQVRTNKKTNAFGKTDKKACEWALLSALKSLQERAKKDGGTKVINITGYYYKNEFDSKTEFQCGAGSIMAGVTLIGDVAK
ncbi:excinuclease ATPase [Campylobacter hyointestinalis subsp. hyointestinalis]|uniref:Excinuclease ATPase n=1 Tax=Campylobacter hyointestinalis subsp. hyointestinalis TaxID=91352 RepID=A0A0S4RA56_CAMHY|nr:hypothetical protein [Campylobacter hyointestinalis]PPB52246.1 excinuclease ABC subunit A [Campylobacter hyointestinalis subsp. hyointestinalis]PPB55752.1 excinuclease ABC subunit A [Campylobacter hyointestinalis subsp. hyointestinalis]PPB69209.1 excinuclease ABC subunit A [Campylobacter hyointestinalis subsp. hyointestinalis]TWO21410.1 excinuclease ABC subunit A [Campylobacter hyointestinalis]CUU70407.1 excinuclease ATPase [Campylobacter hyointestinalis subsp. hyointestinalis]